MFICCNIVLKFFTCLCVLDTLLYNIDLWMTFGVVSVSQGLLKYLKLYSKCYVYESTNACACALLQILTDELEAFSQVLAPCLVVWLDHVYRWVWQPCESINSVTIRSTSETISGLFVVLYVCMCCCQSGCKYSDMCVLHACTKDIHRQWAWWGLIKVAIGKRKTEWSSFHFKQIRIISSLNWLN